MKEYTYIKKLLKNNRK